jgi:hypothetical protein
MAKIRVKTSKLAKSIACRAFYDNMEDSLSVGIMRKGKFYSYVESEFFSLDLARNGKLLNIDVWKPRNDWVVDDNLMPPEDYAREELIILDFRLRTDPAGYHTNPEQDVLHVRFDGSRVDRFVSPANSLIFELSRKDELVGLWITDIEEDFGFRKESAWRRSARSPRV